MISTGDITRVVDPETFLDSRGILTPDPSQVAAAGDLIDAAQAVVETRTNRVLLARAVEFQTRAGFGLRWFVPRGPVQSVTGAQYQDAAGSWQVIDPQDMRLEMGLEEPQIVFAASALSGAPDGAPIRVQMVAGYAVQSDIPRQMIQAVRLIAGDWMAADVAVDDYRTPQVAFAAHRLIAQVRYARPLEWAAA